MIPIFGWYLKKAGSISINRNKISKDNLGFGAASNKILKLTKTKFYLSISPDTVVDHECINILMKSAKSIKYNFSIMSPLSKGKNYGYFADFKKFNQKNF